MDNMISVTKLHREGKMYLNPEELQLITQGRLKEYLNQFDIENYEDYLQHGSFDLKMVHEQKIKSAPFKPSGYQTEGSLSARSIRWNSQTAPEDKRPYSPESKVVFGASEVEVPPEPFQDHQYDTIMLPDCSSGGFCSQQNDLDIRQPIPRPLYKIVQLDFHDFYLLMKLKISYQRKSVSQVMIKENERMAKKSIRKEISSNV